MKLLKKVGDGVKTLGHDVAGGVKALGHGVVSTTSAATAATGGVVRAGAAGARTLGTATLAGAKELGQRLADGAPLSAKEVMQAAFFLFRARADDPVAERHRGGCARPQVVRGPACQAQRHGPGAVWCVVFVALFVGR